MKTKLTSLNFLLTSLVSLSILALAGCNNQSSSSDAAEHIGRSETYEEQGQYRSAILEVRNAIQKDSGNVNHVVRLAELYIAVGAGKPASEALKPWQESQPQVVALPLAEAYVLQGKHLSARNALAEAKPESEAEQTRHDWLAAEVSRLAGNSQEAAKQYRAILDASPEHEQAATGLAKTLINTERQLEALEFLASWRENHGQVAELLYLEGLVHYRLNELEPATNRLTDALTVVPNSDTFLPVRRQTLSLLSRSLTEQGNITEAQVYNQVLAKNTNTELRENTEQALEAIGEGDLDTARSTLQTLLQQNPDNDMVAMLLGAVSLQQGDIEGGEELLSQRVDAETSPVPFIRMSTMAQIDRGKRQQALKTLERSLLARPSDPDLLAMHGVLALADPKTASDGVASLSKALLIDESRSRLRMALAQYYLSQGEQENALEQLRMAFSIEPTDWPVTDFYLSTLLRNDLNSEARDVRGTLASNHSDMPFANLLVAMTDYRLGNTQEAISRIETLIKDSSENWALAHTALARIHKAEGNHEKAISSFIQAAQSNPDDIKPLQEALKVYGAEHSADETVNWLISLSEQQPDLASNSLALAANIQRHQGKLEEARKTLNRNDTPTNSHGENVRSEILIAEAQRISEQGNLEQARAKVAEAISIQPDNLGYHLILVRITAAEGDLAEAQNQLDAIKERFGTPAPVAVTQASLLEQTQTPEEAYTYLKTQWQEQPNPGVAPELLRLSRKVSPEETASIASKWTELSPTTPQAWQNLGDIVLEKGDNQTAMEAYGKVLELQPNNLGALNNLAWLLRDTRPEEAVKLAERAAEIAPENASVLDTYGWVLYRAGQLEEAREVLSKALSVEPDNSEIRQHMDEVEAAL